MKITEKMINSRLKHFIEKRGYFPKSQYGFRKGKSCALTLLKIITEILIANNNKEYICGVAIDIKSAFDNISPHKLQKILEELEIQLKYRNSRLRVKYGKALFCDREVYRPSRRRGM